MKNSSAIAVCQHRVEGWSGVAPPPRTRRTLGRAEGARLTSAFNARRGYSLTQTPEALGGARSTHFQPCGHGELDVVEHVVVHIGIAHT